MLRIADISIGASAEGRCSIQVNTSSIPRTVTAKDGSREKQASGFADAGMFLQKATITVGSSIIGGHCIDEVNLNG